MATLRRLYLNAFASILLLRPYIFLAVGLFLAGALYGALNPEQITGLMARLESLAEEMRGASTLQIVLLIFVNNAVSAAFSILLGPILGLVPGYGALVNGALIGAVLQEQPASIWMLFGHGVFELPAIFLAWGIGLWCGAAAFKGDRWMLMRQRVKDGLRMYALVVIPLLVVAALIEGIAIGMATPEKIDMPEWQPTASRSGSRLGLENVSGAALYGGDHGNHVAIANERKGVNDVSNPRKSVRKSVASDRRLGSRSALRGRLLRSVGYLTPEVSILANAERRRGLIGVHSRCGPFLCSAPISS